MSCRNYLGILQFLIYLAQTWIKENIDSLVNSYIRHWLEIPVSGTLSTIFMTRNTFCLNIIPPSVKFLQCQTILRNALKSMPIM